MNPIPLAYQRTGKGQPLLLVHGFPLDHTFWEPILPHLTPHFDIILPDLRGFGNSPTTASGYNLEDLATDLNALLDHLELPAACLAGHSMGGYIALAFARRFKHRILGLGLLGTQAAPDTPERRQGRYATIEQIKAEGLKTVLGMAEKLSANPAHSPFFRDIIQRQNPSGVMGALQAIAERPDALPQFPGFSFPVAIVHGYEDSLVPVARAREMHAAQPAAILTELPGTGHSPPFEAPAATAAALLQLL
jgi:pimeloyl-ACP methyl ester carboxylesterase